MLGRSLSRLPVGSLIAFEAAARLGSFKDAAAELSLTPSAVSQRMHALEMRLGISLFQRLNREIRLTPQGRMLLDVVGPAFAQLDGILGQLTVGGRQLRIDAAPSFATLWLTPRLADFRRRHPDITVMLAADNRRIDVANDPSVDVALRYGVGPYPGCYALRLLTDRLGVYCHPGPPPPADLVGQVLLRSAPPAGAQDLAPPWHRWSAAAGIQVSQIDKGPVFGNSQMAIQAAIAGHGLVIAPSILVAGDVAAGRLRQAFDLMIQDDFSFWFLCRQDRVTAPAVSGFRRWLQAELSPERQSQPPKPVPVV